MEYKLVTLCKKIRKIDQNKVESIQLNERLVNSLERMSDYYEKVRGSLTTLHERYVKSKETKNIFRRYGMLKSMIRDVIRLHAEYWTLVDLPQQEPGEGPAIYIQRVLDLLDKGVDRRGGLASDSKQFAEDTKRQSEREARFAGMTLEQINEENQGLQNELYKLLKKYGALRTLMNELKDDYHDSKVYPIIPRYTMLKDMIKDVMRDPKYMEVCHEQPQ